MKKDALVYIQKKHSLDYLQAAESEIFLSKIKKNCIVTHKTLGTGIVSKITKDKKYIYVRFGKNEKMFVFYDSFKKGLLK